MLLSKFLHLLLLDFCNFLLICLIFAKKSYVLVPLTPYHLPGARGTLTLSHKDPVIFALVSLDGETNYKVMRHF